ncbi:MAG: rod shape-determining protein MreC [Candidatus Staskawiczbacteria bacterium]|nr:rod shape-determining protein MreC [Candidatus Staskawiczbacteria bacterium]
MNEAKKFSIKHKNKNWLKFLIGAIVFLFLFFVLNIFVSPIRNGFYTISSPIQKIFWSAGESSSLFLSSLSSGGSLAKENENLKIENQKLLSQLAFLQSIEQSNQAQSDVSVSCQNSGFKLVMAGVIGLDSEDILSINKGSADGIAEGMPVINQQNVLFGKISKVYKNFSKVMLISNKNSVINVKTQHVPESASATSSEIDGVVKGEGGLNAYLDLVPISDNIDLQDVLVTSAIEKSFPKDLLVGKIIQKNKNDQKPFQQAEISLFFNVKSSDNLFVIANFKR